MDLTLELLKANLDTVWVLFTGALVFWMNAGFACVEAGFCRAKNCIHVLAMNYMIIAVTTIAFWAVGFGVMFGNGNDFFGTTGFFPTLLDRSLFTSLSGSAAALGALFFFQMAFADTAGTILSGVIAERMKLPAYLLFAFIMGMILYPVTGHWAWGGGWLSKLGFHDFAGSTIVHSVGGWVGLTGALLVGARLGKYDKKTGKPNVIRAHSFPLIALGGFILWLGWFGFNPGSTLAADGKAIGHIFATTNFSGAAATFSALFLSWLWNKGKPDLGMAVNGTLAGLVAITAPCDGVSMAGAVMIGAVAGCIVFFAPMLFDRFHIDDPVGALPVHLMNGIWGTFAFGLFATKAGSVGSIDGLFYGGGFHQAYVQLIGIGAVGAYTVAASTIIWLFVKAVIGLRVPAVAELQGLDHSDHAMDAYVFGSDSPIMTSPEPAENSLPRFPQLEPEPAYAMAE